MLAKNADTGLQGAPLERKKKVKISQFAQAVVKTANVEISRCYFREDGTELFLNACCTCSTFIFPFSTNAVVVAVDVTYVNAPFKM